MRLFVAIDLTDDARAAVAAEQKRIAPAARNLTSGLKWLLPEQLHLTLAFLGEVDEARAATVVAAMQDEIGALPYQVAFGGLGVFPPRGAPRVLWLGLVAGHQETIDLQGVVTMRLERLGIERELRPFHPHLTLGRWRTDRRTREPRSAAGLRKLDANDDREIARVEVTTVTLFHSRLSPSGATHTPLTQARLR